MKLEKFKEIYDDEDMLNVSDYLMDLLELFHEESPEYEDFQRLLEQFHSRSPWSHEELDDQFRDEG